MLSNARRLLAQRRRARLHRRMALDRGQREHGERQLARRVVVVRGLRGVRERLEGQHPLRAGHELGRHPVLERGVEAGVAVEPVEGQRAVHVAHVRGSSPCGGLVGAKLLDRASRERLVAGEEPREREAREIVGRTFARGVARLQCGQAGEGVALREKSRGRATAAGSAARDTPGAVASSSSARPAVLTSALDEASMAAASSRRTASKSRRSRRNRPSHPRPRRRAARPRERRLQLRLEPELARQGQVLVVLQAAAEVRELDGPIGPAMPRSSSGWSFSSPG